MKRVEKAVDKSQEIMDEYEAKKAEYEAKKAESDLRRELALKKGPSKSPSGGRPLTAVKREPSSQDEVDRYKRPVTANKSPGRGDQVREAKSPLKYQDKRLEIRDKSPGRAKPVSLIEKNPSVKVGEKKVEVERGKSPLNRKKDEDLKNKYVRKNSGNAEKPGLSRPYSGRPVMKREKPSLTPEKMLKENKNIKANILNLGLINKKAKSATS